MHRFFAIEDANGIRLRDADAVHALRVLRLGPGTDVEVVLNEERFQATIKSCENGTVRVQLQTKLKSTEPNVSIVLYQGLPKADKLEWIVQKCTELGASAIQPVIMERSIVHSDEKTAIKKTDRLRKIAEEAVKQCGRIVAPDIRVPKTISQVIEEMQGLDLILVPWEEESGTAGNLREYLLRLDRNEHAQIGIVIGPEGGISRKEIDWLRENAKAVTISLGPRILRTETAAITSVALTLAYCHEME